MERQPNETRRDYLNRKRKLDKDLSRQVQRSEMSIESGDSMAELGGLIKKKSPPIEKNEEV